MADVSSSHETPAPPPAPHLHRLALRKGDQHWNFRWTAGDEALLINRIAELARDPAIPFDWYDAAVLCKHIAQPFGTSCAADQSTNTKHEN